MASTGRRSAAAAAASQISRLRVNFVARANTTTRKSNSARHDGDTTATRRSSDVTER